MPSAQSSGIQTLMDAEKEAKQIITLARDEKVRRLKQAREDADREIEQLRNQKENEFKANAEKNAGSTDDATRKLEEETNAKLLQIQQVYLANKNNVIAKLLEAVQTVDPKPHMNAIERV